MELVLESHHHILTAEEGCPPRDAQFRETKIGREASSMRHSHDLFKHTGSILGRDAIDGPGRCLFDAPSEGPATTVEGQAGGLLDLQSEDAHQRPIDGGIRKKPAPADGASSLAEQIEGGTVDRVAAVQHPRLTERIECDRAFHDTDYTKKIIKDSLGIIIIFFISDTTKLRPVMSSQKSQQIQLTPLLHPTGAGRAYQQEHYPPPAALHDPSYRAVSLVFLSFLVGILGVFIAILVLLSRPTTNQPQDTDLLPYAEYPTLFEAIYGAAAQRFLRSGDFERSIRFIRSLPPVPSSASDRSLRSDPSPPIEYDLRKEYPGLIALPADQGVCGSCTVFAILSAVRDIHSIRDRVAAPVLSYQYVIDLFTVCINDNNAPLPSVGSAPAPRILRQNRLFLILSCCALILGALAVIGQGWLLSRSAPYWKVIVLFGSIAVVLLGVGIGFAVHIARLRDLRCDTGQALPPRELRTVNVCIRGLTLDEIGRLLRNPSSVSPTPTSMPGGIPPILCAGVGVPPENVYRPYLFALPSGLDLQSTSSEYVRQWSMLLMERLAHCPSPPAQYPFFSLDGRDMRTIAKYGIDQMYYVFSDRTDSVASEMVLKNNLLRFGTVVFAWTFPESFTDHEITSRPTDYDPADFPDRQKIVGGHAMCIIGWTKTAWIVRNSWGMDWGHPKDPGCIHIRFGGLREFQPDSTAYFGVLTV